VGENTSQIEREIRAERTELGRNLRELETKARIMTDWRTHHRNNPGLFMGLAFSGGVVLGLLSMPRRAATRDFETYEEPFDAAPVPPRRRLRVPRVVTETRDLAGRQLGQTWEHIASALLGVASAKAVELVAEMIPGFRDHYEGGADDAGAREPIRQPSGY
jgi:hypothetical protein